MPHYQTWGATPQHLSRLPPTPPDYQGEYLTPSNTMVDTYYPVHGLHSRQNSTRERSDRYHQTSYPGQHSSHAHPRMNHMFDSYTQGHAYQYSTGQAPILPPIRAHMPIDPYQYSLPEKKEEKPTGGVAQHLDYEMDVMASFVAEMAQKL
jgi:hypothetical protein